MPAAPPPPCLPRLVGAVWAGECDHGGGAACSQQPLLCAPQVTSSDLLSPGLAVRAAPLEGEPQPGEPYALGEPVHHPPLPEPPPARAGRDLRGGVAASPQRAHAACGPAAAGASAGQRPLPVPSSHSEQRWRCWRLWGSQAVSLGQGPPSLSGNSVRTHAHTCSHRET